MAEVLERGRVTFLFRPKVDVSAPRGIDDVQRFWVVLAHAAGRRRIAVGRKRMPHLRDREANWGFVDALDADVARDLDEREYVTKTRGERLQPGARRVAEGDYALVRHGDHVHLTWNVAEEDPEMSRELEIGPRGSVLVAVLHFHGWVPARPEELDRHHAELLFFAHTERAEIADETAVK